MCRANEKDYLCNPDVMKKNLSFFSLSHPTGPDYPVQAEEGGQALLDCFVPWHRLLMERPEYYYSWAPGVPGTKMVSLTSLNLKHKYKEKLKSSLANHYQKSPTFSY